MRRTLLSLAAVAVCVLVGDSTRASVAVRLTFEQLSARADRVVEVRLTEARSSWDASHHLIWTRFSFEVERTLAGPVEDRLEVLQPGGVVGRIGQRTYGYPEFRIGERVILFLRRADGGYRVVGLSQGVFVRQPLADGGEWVQRLEGLAFEGDAGAPLRLPAEEALHRLRQARSPGGAGDAP